MSPNCAFSIDKVCLRRAFLITNFMGRLPTLEPRLTLSDILAHFQEANGSESACKVSHDDFHDDYLMSSQRMNRKRSDETRTKATKAYKWETSQHENKTFAYKVWAGEVYDELLNFIWNFRRLKKGGERGGTRQMQVNKAVIVSRRFEMKILTSLCYVKIEMQRRNHINLPSCKLGLKVKRQKSSLQTRMLLRGPGRVLQSAFHRRAGVYPQPYFNPFNSPKGRYTKNFLLFVAS